MFSFAASAARNSDFPCVHTAYKMCFPAVCGNMTANTNEMTGLSNTKFVEQALTVIVQNGFGQFD
jgi:hypothetical protein